MLILIRMKYRNRFQRMVIKFIVRYCMNNLKYKKILNRMNYHTLEISEEKHFSFN